MPADLKPCVHCQRGTENQFGDIWHDQFPIKSDSITFHRPPRILKRNNRYFLLLENFPLFQIKACPLCGRRFEDAN